MGDSMMVEADGNGYVPAHPCLQEPLAITSFETVERMPRAMQASGDVFRVRHKESGVVCVFKVVVVPMVDAEIPKALDGVKAAWRGGRPHPNVMPLIDCGYDRPTGRFIIVTEWMDGLSLRDHIRIQTNPVPEQVVGCIVSQLIAALAHLHKEWHRAHRDLKPGNILLDTQGGVRVTDLGQSKQMAATLGMMGSFVGAQVYMSPQRIQGASYTSACDVWSVGLIAQECLEGEFPYHKVLRSQGMEPSVDLLIEVMEEEAPPPLAPETFGQNARDFCSAALTLAEERRPTSMSLMQHPYVVECKPREPLAQWIAASLPLIHRDSSCKKD